METTKVHKFIVYAYGINDQNNSSNIYVQNIIDEIGDDLIIHSYHDKSIEIDEIGDDHPLNNKLATMQDFEKYMDPELQKLFQEAKIANERLKKYKQEKVLE